MMIKRIFIGIPFLMLSMSWLNAQQKPVLFEESRKAIAALEGDDHQADSLKGIYKGRFSIDILFGGRFILPHNITELDTITGADFTSRKAFYGIGTSYYINQNLSISANFDFAILPRVQRVSNISIGNGGASGDGEGSGGTIINLNLGAKYYFLEWGNTRPYAGVYLGTSTLFAKGGEVSFTAASGANSEDLGEIRQTMSSGQVLLGFSRRIEPGFIFDFNVGYHHTQQIDAVGGITSPGGITTSLSARFILNARKKSKE